MVWVMLWVMVWVLRGFMRLFFLGIFRGRSTAFFSVFLGVFRHFFRLFNFLIHAMMPPLGICDVEKSGDIFSGGLPFIWRHRRQASENYIIVRQRPAALPIFHQEEKISAVLGRAEMARVAKIIANVERHPSARVGVFPAHRNPSP